MKYLTFVRCTILPQRIVLGIMGFLGILVSFTMRACLSIAITEMVIPSTIHQEIHNDSSSCPADSLPLDHIEDTKISATKYDWSQEQQGWILSAYYFGYLIAHIPGALLAQKFGGKWTLAFEILTITVCNVLIPPALLYGGENALILLIILRILMGLGAGPQFPTVLVLLAAWIPRNERGVLGSLCLSGGVLGILLSFLLSGMILSISAWPLVFYFWSFIGLIWFIIFILICNKDPASHPFITKKERDYLEQEIGQLERSKVLPPTPWTKILTSVPVIALIIAQIGSDWADYFFQSDMPKYMSDVLKFPAQDIGLFSAMPCLFIWIISLASGALCDYLLSKQYISVIRARKLFAALSGFFPPILFIVSSYAGCNKSAFVISITLAGAFRGTYFTGIRINSLDLSPNYAASILSIVNACGAVMGIIVPIFIGMMTPESTMEQWRLVFWTVGCIHMISTIVFLIWASAEVQPWNHSNDCDNKSISNNATTCEK